MLQDVYERLLLRRLDPRWVGTELHVDVHGRGFTIRGSPDSLSIRILATTAPVTFDDPDDVLAAMGLALDATG